MLILSTTFLFAFLSFCLLQHTLAYIQSLRNVTSRTQYIVVVTGLEYRSIYVINQNIAQLQQKKGKQSTIRYNEPSLQSPVSRPIWGQENQTSSIRSSSYNRNLTVNNSIIVWSKKKVELLINLTNLIDIFNTADPDISVQDACFGNNQNQILVIILQKNIVTESNKEYYGIKFYNDTVLIRTVYLKGIPITNVFDKVQFENSRIMLTFTALVQVYTISNFDISNTTLMNVSFAKAVVEEIDSQLGADLAFFSVKNRLTIFNLTSATFVLQKNFTDIIRSFTLLRCYVLARTANTIVQYDYQINQIIYSLSFKQPNQFQINSYNNQTSVVVYADDPTKAKTQYFMFNVSIDYIQSANQTCNVTYEINPSTARCEKNFSIPPPPLATSFTVSFDFPAPPVVVVAPPIINNSYTDIIDTVMPNSTAQTVGTVLVATTLRVTPKFMMIFTLFLNDLWFYQYHRKQNPQYPLSVKIFMNKVDIMKQFQVNPDFLGQVLPFLNENQTCLSNNQDLYARLNFTQNDPTQVYFLYSTQSFYQNNIVVTLMFFAIFKIFHSFVYLIRRKCNKLKSIYHYVRWQTKWWTVVIALIQPNGVMLSFYGAIQLLDLGSVTFIDKVNIVVMLTFIFVIIFYAHSFYKIVETYSGKKSREILLIYTKQKKSSTLLEPLLILSRSMTKSFFHGYLLPNYKTQISTLPLVDLIFLILCLKIKNKFKNKFVFLFMSCYFLAFFAFDCCFAVEEYGGGRDITDADREMLGFIFCCLLMFLSIFLSLSLIYEAIVDMYKSIKNFCKNDANNERVKKNVNVSDNQIKNRLQKQKQKQKHHSIDRPKPNQFLLTPNKIAQEPRKSKIEQGISFNFIGNDKKVHKAVVKLHKKHKKSTFDEEQQQKAYQEYISQIEGKRLKEEKKKKKQKSIKVKSAFDGHYRNSRGADNLKYIQKTD